MTDAAPVWFSTRSRQDLVGFHDRLLQGGYKYKSSESKETSARHHYTHKSGASAVINEYAKGGHTLTKRVGDGAGFRKDGRCKHCQGTGAIKSNSGCFGVVKCPACKGLGKRATDEPLPVGDEKVTTHWAVFDKKTERRRGDYKSEAEAEAAAREFAYELGENRFEVRWMHARDIQVIAVGDAAQEVIEVYKTKKIRRGKRDDAVSVEGIGNAARYFTGWTEASRVAAAKVAVDKYLASQPKRSNTVIEQANRDIQYAVRTGELDGDSDANEIRQVLASYSKEVQEHFVRDLGRARDEILPVGEEDPERAEALRKHAEGETVSQDRTKRAGMKDVKLVGDSAKSRAALIKKAASQGHQPATIAKFLSMDVAEVKKILATAAAKDEGGAVQPVPIKTSNLVPMPAEEDDHERYAADKRKGKDGNFEDYKASTANNWEAALIPKLEKLVEQADDHRRRSIYQEALNSAKDDIKRIRSSKDMKEHDRHADHLRYLKRMHAADSRRATDAAVLPLQVSGSEPKDHMLRANQYEVAGDRARALDSYRSAASGYRKANDRAGESKAREGIDACQARFATQYEHPSVGRVKVCDSADAALRTAVERTRAGESVRLEGKTVKPGRARAGDDTGGPPPIDNPVEPDVTAPVPDAKRAKDGPHDEGVDELVKRIKKVVKEARADGTVGMSKGNLKQMVSSAGLRFANANHFERSFSEALQRAAIGRFVTDSAKARDRELQPV